MQSRRRAPKREPAGKAASGRGVEPPRRCAAPLSGFEKWKRHRFCRSCGVPWIEHNGIASTCAALMASKLELFRLREHLAGAMAFRLLVYLSVLKPGQPHTVLNLLAALKKLRMKRRMEK